MRKMNYTLYELLNYIYDFKIKNSYSPTVREMATYMNVNSTCTITYYLNKLLKLGLIKKDKLKSRTLEIVGSKSFWLEKLEIKKIPPKYNHTKITANTEPETSETYTNSDTIEVPLIGKVTAGQPILAQEELMDIYSLPFGLFRKSDIFMLNVKGESMIEAGILNGDKIVVKKQNSANNGDIVVALINDEATVKTFYKEHNFIRLQPQNSTMEPIIVPDVTIIGKVIGLVRNY